MSINNNSHDMTKHIECAACGAVLPSVQSLGPSPVGRDECPKCGYDTFQFVE